MCSTSRSGGGEERSSWPGSMQGSSGLRISTGRRGVVLRRHHGGQEGARLIGGEKSIGRGKLTGERSGEIPAQHGARAEAKASRGLPASWRCPCAGWPGLRCGGVAWPRRGALLWAGARRRLGLGDAGVRGREQEITGRCKEPGPRISASGIGRKGCGDRGQGSRPVCCTQLLCERRAQGRRWP